MVTNKWWLTALGALSTVMSYFATVDWTTLVPSKGGIILMALTVAKTVMSSLLPPQSTIQAAAAAQATAQATKS